MELVCRSLSMEQAGALFESQLREDFPESELKPWDYIRGLCEQGLYQTLGFFSGDALIGYAWLVCPEGGAVLLDYLAVCKPYRCCGTGGQILQMLVRRFCVGGGQLLLESERPDDAPDPQIARRRLGFYRRNGFLPTAVEVRLFGVPFCILAYGDCPDAAAKMRRIYRAMFPPEIYASGVCFFPLTR